MSSYYTPSYNPSNGGGGDGGASRRYPTNSNYYHQASRYIPNNNSSYHHQVSKYPASTSYDYSNYDHNIRSPASQYNYTPNSSSSYSSGGGGKSFFSFSLPRVKKNNSPSSNVSSTNIGRSSSFNRGDRSDRSTTNNTSSSYTPPSYYSISSSGGGGGQQYIHYPFNSTASGSSSIPLSIVNKYHISNLSHNKNNSSASTTVTRPFSTYSGSGSTSSPSRRNSSSNLNSSTTGSNNNNSNYSSASYQDYSNSSNNSHYYPHHQQHQQDYGGGGGRRGSSPEIINISASKSHLRIKKKTETTNQGGSGRSSVLSGESDQTGTDLSSKNENGVTPNKINYRKLYEEILKENHLLKTRLARSEEEILDLKLKMDKFTATPRIALDDSETAKKEKRALERKLSEMEEELKLLQKLKLESEKLKAENRALTRVVSKLSNNSSSTTTPRGSGGGGL